MWRKQHRARRAKAQPLHNPSNIVSGRSRFFCSGERGPALAGKIFENEKRGRGTDCGEQEAVTEAVKDHVTDGEERAVDHDDAGEPIGEVGAEIADLREFGAELGDGLPAVNARVDAAIERDEFFLGLGFCNESTD